jgi:hypothetical protein
MNAIRSMKNVTYRPDTRNPQGGNPRCVDTHGAELWKTRIQTVVLRTQRFRKD